MARIGTWAFALILAAVALVLLVGGIVLISEGGSPYYLAAGLLAAVSAVALVRRKGLAVRAYALLLAGTLAWSLWEAALDGWALAPRLLGPAVLGTIFLMLPIKALSGSPSRWWLGAPVFASFAAIALAGVLAISGEASTSPYSRTVAASGGATDWRSWGGAPGGGHYAAATEITPGNVGKLELAWRFDSDLPPPLIANFEGTPLAFGDHLYACLTTGTVIALDQVSGKEIWRYATPDNAKYDFTRMFSGKCRGVSFHQSPEELPACTNRILFASPDGYLRAIDADDGKSCNTFGEDGAVDLHAGMEDQLPGSRFKVEAIPSSPAAIIGNVAIVGQSVSDLASLDAPSGVIRGYNVLSGELLWSWSAGIEDSSPEDSPGDIYTRASPNAWGPLSGDEELGLVYVPLGNSPPDYFGGMRAEALDKFTTAVVALDVATGELRWSFQTVHHDLWDYDLAAQPTVADLPGEDGVRQALLVPTKLGQIFTLDRATGKPIDAVEERPVPQGGVPGERTAPTQPFTTGFPQLGGDDLSESDMWGMTPLDQMWCRITFLRSNYQGRFTPITTERTLMFPGTAGGINWGGVSIDQARGLMIVNTLRFANFGRLVARKEMAGQDFGGAKGQVIFGQEGTPWVFAQSTFMSPLGVPCQKPPFGTINALDLKTRKLVWSKSFGTSAMAGPFNFPSLLPIRMGVPNMGGSVVTAGGLTFIGAAQDRRLRAYDSATGRELWSFDLPAIAAASPMSFVSPQDGRQYVVIASGGHYALPGPQAGAIMAFALPQE
ncbi:MAG: PQQ-binding-like beta-propeller repeat protein [Novosphingobium sp.]|nr:PQQ-binding-like beta-propeller repeat protein [Novosphingobium sp.]